MGTEKDSRAAVLRELGGLPLIDHHVHTTVVAPPTVLEFEQLISESRESLGAGQSRFDSSVGLALGAHCGSLLTGSAVAALDYFSVRSAHDERKLDELFLGSAGVSDWLIDTGHAAEKLVSLGQFAESSGGAVHEILRLESLAEEILAGGVDPASFPAAFQQALLDRVEESDGADRTARVVGFKTIAAYRCGFNIDWNMPSEKEVIERLQVLGPHERARLADPLVICYLIHVALQFGKPLQFHVGLGDRDVDFLTCSPLLLRPLLVIAERRGTPIALLHCAPFEREAGYLCQNFTNVYMDVGLAVNLSGVFAAAPIRRALEWCPFPRLLYSSDAWGMPELHYLGAVLWRRGLAEILAEWIDSGTCTLAEASRIALSLGSGNARRLYQLD